nr:MAG TPA: hypothetical protein [Caudoviricetes sp.]
MEQVKIKEYASKIKSRIVGQHEKPQVEEKEEQSEKAAETTRETIAEELKEVDGVAVAEGQREADGAAVAEATEKPKEERNIALDVMKLAAVTKGMKVDPEWKREEVIKAVAEYGGLTEEEAERLLESGREWTEEALREMREGFAKMIEGAKKAVGTVAEAMTKEFRRTGRTVQQLRHALMMICDTNNRRKMKGMAMTREKALEKAQKNARRKTQKQKEGV